MKERNQSKFKRLLAVALCLCLVVGVLPTWALATGATSDGSSTVEEEVTSAEITSTEDSDDTSLSKGSTIEGTDFTVTSLKSYSVAPDVSEMTIITNNSEGTSQTVANVMEVTPGSSAYTVVGFGDIEDPIEWCLATTTAQCALWESVTGDNVVGGVNAAWFNITTGEPAGMTVINGYEVKEDNTWPYFATYSDGSCSIEHADVSLDEAAEKQSEKQGYTVTVTGAVAAPAIMVENGEVVNTVQGNSGYYSRTAVGIKADGTVVLFQADGTMAPRSVGYTQEEEAQMMIALGCEIVLQLDEGGSSTFVSQREGEDSVTMRNTAAGGSERGVSSTILVVSTVASNGEFDHVNITPDNEIYTPNSEVQLTATGMDYSGAQSNSIPDSVTWALAEGSEDMGTLTAGEISGNQATATFVSNGTYGTATINMLYNGEVVGSTDIRIYDPDELSFTSDEINLNYGEESDLGLVAQYENETLNLKDGDITWSITDETIGTFEGNTFVVTSDTSVSASATVTATYGSLTASTIINIGKEPTIIMDGGDEDGWDYSNIGTTVESFDGLAADAVATYHYAGRGGVVTGAVVSDTDEDYADIVRFGHNAIKLEFDWTGITGTDGACLGLGDSIDVTGSPTAIGVWVYIPDESTPIPWLRAQIATSTDGGTTWTNAYINFNAGTSDDAMQVGWQYLEADLTAYSGALIRVNSGMLFRAMVTTAGIGWYTVDGTKLDKSALTGYLIIDNICFVYGSNNQDTTNPTVSSISLLDETGTKTELENGTVVTSNDLILYATYDDNEDTDAFATGVESAYFYLDGTYYGTGDQDNLGSTLAVTMANGSHSVTFYLKDAYGNVTRETRYFTVEAEDSTLTNMGIQVESVPSIGSEWTLDLISNNPTDIAQASTTISISKAYAVSDVTFADGVTGTYEYDSSKGTLTISITAVDSSVTNTTLATISVTIPNTVTQGSAVTVQVTKGTYETVSDAEYWKGFSTALLSYTIGADYVLTTDTLVVGLPGTITVTADELPIANLSIYCDDELLGTTDENGQLVTSDLTAAAGSYTLYAMDENGSRSYPVTVTVYTPAGEEDGTPYYVLTNVTSDATSEKNISWMSNPVYSSDTAQIRISSDSALDGATVINGSSTLVTYTSSGVANRANSVYVTGLSAGTTYYYQVGDGTTWSEISSFTTAESGDTQTDFYVIADIQEDDAVTGMTRIASLLGESDYDFGIQLGDAVDNVRYYNQWTTALDLFTLDGISGTDLLHVIGNHEADDDGNDSYAAMNIFNLEDDWYSVEYGDVYVAVLNYTQNTSKLAEFSAWLVEDAAATSCTWKVLVAHVPVYYTNPTGGGATYLEALPDAIEEAGIDFYFAGNDHSYARTSPVTDGEVDEDNGVVYYICGSTGGKSYSVVNNDAFNFEIATIDFDSIYLSVSATASQMTITAYNVDEDGNATVFDAYTKEQTYCENDEHDYIYDRETDELTCSKCAFRSTMAEELVSGFVTDKATGKLMYMVSGTPVTVCMHYGDDFYFADDEGLAYDGEYVIDGQTIVFEDGYFVSSTTASVRFAGRATETVDFILYTDGTFKLLGSGVVEFDRVWNSPYYLYRNYVTSVIVDENITALGNWACYSFTKATSITFGDNSKITRIGQNAFSRWYALTEIVLPDGVTYIGYDAFTDCTALTSAYIPDVVSSIMTNAFSGCSNVTLSVGYNSYAKEFAIAHNISYVEREPSTIASGECGTNLTWTLTSDGILTISGTGSMNTYGTAPWYSYRTIITTVIIGADVTKLTTNAFYNCTKLATVTFEDGSKLTAIGGSVFKNCTSLREITLPDGLLTISGNAFRFCNNLYVYLPESVTYIDAVAFSSTSDITLSVGKDTYAMQYAITYGMTYVVRDPVTVASGECGTDLTWTLTSDGVLTISGTGSMSTYGTAPWYSYRTSITAVVIGAGVTKLTTNAFYNCTKLATVTFEDGSKLTAIGGSVFKNCTSLREITLPDGLLTISGNAFRFCNNLYVYLPESVTYIDAVAFSSTSDITLSVGKDTYAMQYAITYGMTYVVREPVTVASGECGTDLTWTLTSDGVLTITGTGSMSTYSTAPWYSYRTSITTVVVGAGVTKLTTNAFYNCTKLETVTFEDGSKLAYIGGSVFKNCTSLREITLPDGLLTISGNAFRFCNNLYVYLPESVTYIDAVAFSSTSDITLSVGKDTYAMQYAITYGMTYVVREPVTVASGDCGTDLTWTLTSDGILTITGTGSMSTYGTAPWYSYRTSITAVVVGAGVTKLTTNAFYNCTKLATVTFEDGSKLASIGGSVFKNCTSLREITLPDGLTDINGNAFRFCTNLNVYVPTSVSYIATAAFSSTTDVTLYVYENSYAHQWAISNGMAYVIVDADDGDDTSVAAAETVEEVEEVDTSLIEEDMIVVTEEDTVVILDSGYCGETATWTLTSDGLLAISGTGTMDSYTEEEAAPWTVYCEQITSVEIGESIEEIGAYAFYNLTEVTAVTFDDESELTVISDYAFAGCTALVSVVLPGKLETIGEAAFADCSALEFVEIPESVINLGVRTVVLELEEGEESPDVKGAFDGCTLLYVKVADGSAAASYAADNSLSIYTEIE